MIKFEKNDLAMKSDPKQIEYNKLILDDCNPRLPKSLHNKQENEIIDYLLLEASTLELMQAIGENDFFIGEQLLVVKIENDKYKVIEGNRRLASIKLLHNYKLASVKKTLVKQVYDEAKFRPTLIPCLLFPTEDSIRKYLGFRHITGIKAWGLSEKARYLSDLSHSFSSSKSIDEISRELAKVIGSKREYVKRLLVGFNIYKYIEDEGFFSIRDLDDTTFFVGYISDSLSRSGICAFLGVNLSLENPLVNLNKENVKKLTHWFFEKNDQNKTRLKGKSEDLNTLNSILSNEKSYNAFDVEGWELSKAYELTKEYSDIVENAIKKALENLELADSLAHKAKFFYVSIVDDLDDIRKIALKIKRFKEEYEDEN
jgi:hypothetical protein